MRRLRRVFNQIMAFCRLPMRWRTRDIEKGVDAKTLARVLQEARFLSSHAVAVNVLAPGEEAGMPRPADPANAPD